MKPNVSLLIYQSPAAQTSLPDLVSEPEFGLGKHHGTSLDCVALASKASRLCHSDHSGAGDGNRWSAGAPCAFRGRDLLDSLLTLANFGACRPPCLAITAVLLRRRSTFGAWLHDSFGINLTSPGP